MAKGHLVKVNFEVINSNWGKNALERVLAAIKPEHARILTEKPILSSAWYPFPAHADLAMTSCRLLMNGDVEYYRIGARTHLGLLSKFLHRILFMTVRSPQDMINKGPSFWKMNFNMGKVEVSHTGPGECSFEASGFPFDHQYFEVWNGTLFWFEDALARSGAKNIRSRLFKPLNGVVGLEFKWDR